MLTSIVDNRSVNCRLELLENAVLLVVRAIHVMFITSIHMFITSIDMFITTIHMFITTIHMFITSIEVMIGVVLYIMMLSVNSSDLLRHAGLVLNIQFRKHKFQGASFELGMNFLPVTQYKQRDNFQKHFKNTKY